MSEPTKNALALGGGIVRVVDATRTGNDFRKNRRCIRKAVAILTPAFNEGQA